MRKIILNVAVSLDGFIEGPNGEIDWLSIDGGTGADSFFDKFLADIDTIFYGRVSYDLWGEYQPGPDASLFEKTLWQSVHSKSKYVFTRNPLKKGETKATYISTNLSQTVQTIKSNAGKNIWLYGGANLISTFINLGLVDKYLLAIYPVILGAGKPLFSDIQKRAMLVLNETTRSESGVLLVDYDVNK